MYWSRDLAKAFLAVKIGHINDDKKENNLKDEKKKIENINNNNSNDLNDDIKHYYSEIVPYSFYSIIIILFHASTYIQVII